MSTLRLGSEQVFAGLDVYHDVDSRSAALNMAIDEAILETATEPTIRFYRWNHPAISFGYFGNFAEVEKYESERDIVRRWTGGGVVLHRHDLTYSIVIPAPECAFSGWPRSIYEQIHIAMRNALRAAGKNVELAQKPTPKISEACFANPVRADVLLDGRKIAGAAQRRTRRGLLQQGSIQDVDLPTDFEEGVVAELAGTCREQMLCDSILERAHQIAREKYATDAWLRRR